MRKFIFFSIQVLFLCLVSMQSYAVTAEECENAESQETCPAGCYFDSREGCRICGLGTYTSESGQTSCKACIHPSGEKGKKWDWVANVEGNENAYCPFTISCAKDEYIDVKNVGESGGFGCKQCGSYYNSKEPDDYTITINNLLELLAAITNKTKENVCDGKVYKLTLVKNLSDLFESNKYAYVKYDTGFSDEETGPFLFDGTAPGVVPTTILWWRDFLGYYTAETGGAIRFNENGGTAGTQTTPKTFESDTTLYGHWDEEPVEYNVEYYTDSSMTTNFGEPQTCEMGMLCPVIEDIPSQSGKLFDHWVCGAGCSGVVTGNVPEPSESYYNTGDPIKIYAEYSDCPEGHFCSGGDQQPCPSGTTSDPGAANDADCYMKAGDGGTKFCDGTGKCFYLPGNGKIPKNPSSDTTQNSAQNSTQNSAQ